MSYGRTYFDVAGTVGDRLRKLLRTEKQLDLALNQTVTPVVDVIRDLPLLDIIQIDMDMDDPEELHAFKNESEFDYYIISGSFSVDGGANLDDIDIARLYNTSLAMPVLDNIAAPSYKWVPVVPYYFPSGFAFLVSFTGSEATTATMYALVEKRPTVTR